MNMDIPICIANRAGDLIIGEKVLTALLKLGGQSTTTAVTWKKKKKKKKTK